MLPGAGPMIELGLIILPGPVRGVPVPSPTTSYRDIAPLHTYITHYNQITLAPIQRHYPSREHYCIVSLWESYTEIVLKVQQIFLPFKRYTFPLTVIALGCLRRMVICCAR